MAADKRRFPRAIRNDAAELRVGRAAYPVIVDSLSPEGIGIVAEGPVPDDIAAGKRVELHLLRQRIELPAVVRWASRTDPRRPRAGLHVQMALAPAAQRHAFAEWVVPMLLRARQSA